MNFFTTKNNNNNIKEHLSYCGYTIENTESGNMLCDKGSGPGMLVMCHENEITLFGRYKLNQIAKNNLSDLLDFVNELNNSALLITTLVNKKDGYIEFRALYQGDYNKKSFSQFIKYWENDVIYNIDNHPNTDYFLGNGAINNSIAA